MVLERSVLFSMLAHQSVPVPILGIIRRFCYVSSRQKRIEMSDALSHEVSFGQTSGY